VGEGTTFANCFFTIFAALKTLLDSATVGQERREERTGFRPATTNRATDAVRGIEQG
jgi:hypothetical protein